MRSDRANILGELRQNIYGAEPPLCAVNVTRTKLRAQDAGGIAGAEQWAVDLGAAGLFHLILVLPSAPLPAPTIVVQNFCGNRAALPGRPSAVAAPRHDYPCLCKSGLFDALVKAIMGQHINGPPLSLIAARGYALALFYGGDIVPDDAQEARKALARFAATDTGAIAAWAWTYSRALDALLMDKRIDPNRIAAWGQSRNGKAALLAGAADERFAAIVALQAGRGGDALTSHRGGESVAHITSRYPHWFSPRFADFVRTNPPVDQDQLLALIAPRPLLLMHGSRDHWADPAGAQAALECARTHAAPTWRCASVTRPGGHGITSEDWRATLDFLDANMGSVRR